MIYEAEELKRLIDNAKYAVFFGGAGVSTDSGIPDFRGTGGLYSSDEGQEYYLSHSCLFEEPEKFYEFFKQNMMLDGIGPNDAHYALAALEREGKIKAVITQNIDCLHQRAGSKRVIELHGTSERFYCSRCGKIYSPDYVLSCGGVPVCDACGGLVRPDVTLYGEGLDGFSFSEAEQEVQRADLLIVAGTSLTVYPAAGLVADYSGEHLVIINYTPTPYDSMADMVIYGSISEVLGQIVKQ